MTSQGKSRGTISTYTNAVRAFLKWCEDTSTPAVLDKKTVQTFIAYVLDSGLQSTTAKTRQHGLKMYAKWLLEEGEITKNELKELPPPKLHLKVTDALTAQQVTDLIKACKGNHFADRRAEALVRLMVETGVRASEALAIKVTDVNLPTMTALIYKGKGAKGRLVPFSAHCATALDRYLRMRRKQNLPDSGPLWVGIGGRSFGYYGLRQSLTNRAKKAGIPGFHLHLMRHTFAKRWLDAEGSEQGLMAIAGWTTRDMLDRYTSSSALDRAMGEARKLNLGVFE